MKAIQICKRFNDDIYEPTPVQAVLDAIPTGTAIERPDLADRVVGFDRARVVQVKQESGVYARTTGQFFAIN